jgi:hypothetical protein
MLRLLAFCLRWRRLRRENPELFDGAAAKAAVLAAIRQDGD